MTDKDKTIEDILRRLTAAQLKQLDEMTEMLRRLQEHGSGRSGYNIASPKTRRRALVGEDRRTSRLGKPRSD
jgi:hypothetical protein